MQPLQYIFIAMMLCVLAYLALNVLGWVLRRYFLAPPAQVSSVSVLSSSSQVPDMQTDKQTNIGLSAIQAAIQAKQIDVIKGIIIDTLVREGANTDIVRQTIKGDTAALDAKVGEARERLGISPPERKLNVRDNGGPVREIAFK